MVEKEIFDLTGRELVFKNFHIHERPTASVQFGQVIITLLLFFIAACTLNNLNIVIVHRPGQAPQPQLRVDIPQLRIDIPQLRVDIPQLRVHIPQLRVDR